MKKTSAIERQVERQIEREFGLGAMMRRREASDRRKERAAAANEAVEVFFEENQIDVDALASITEEDFVYALECIRKYCPGLLDKYDAYFSSI